MDTYDEYGNTVELKEISYTFSLRLDDDTTADKLAERVGRRRANEIIAQYPMIAVTAVDNGGAYVDIYLFGSPVAVVNTWDYGKGARTVPFTQDGTHDLIMEWIDDDLSDYLNEYT